MRSQNTIARILGAAVVLVAVGLSPAWPHGKEHHDDAIESPAPSAAVPDDELRLAVPPAPVSAPASSPARSSHDEVIARLDRRARDTLFSVESIVRTQRLRVGAEPGDAFERDESDECRRHLSSSTQTLSEFVAEVRALRGHATQEHIDRLWHLADVLDGHLLEGCRDDADPSIRQAQAAWMAVCTSLRELRHVWPSTRPSTPVPPSPGP